jgi:hypothetical protein
VETVLGEHRLPAGDAPDVVADSGRADVLRIGDHAPDGLGVADVPVGAQGGGHRVAGLGAALELVNRAGVDVAEDGELVHGTVHATERCGINGDVIG